MILYIKGCDYSDASILVTGDITVDWGNDTSFEFENCAIFGTRKTEINNVFFDKPNHIHIAMPTIIRLIIVIIIQTHQEADGSLKDMKLQLMMLSLEMIIIYLNHFNAK